MREPSTSCQVMQMTQLKACSPMLYWVLAGCLPLPVAKSNTKANRSATQEQRAASHKELLALHHPVGHSLTGLQVLV